MSTELQESRDQNELMEFRILELEQNQAKVRHILFHQIYHHHYEDDDDAYYHFEEEEKNKPRIHVQFLNT